MLRKGGGAKCTFRNFRSLPQLGHRSLEAEGRLGGFDRQLVVPVEVYEVSDTVEAAIPGPYHTLGVHQEEVLPALALHPGEHVLPGGALGLPHLG